VAMEIGRPRSPKKIHHHMLPILIVSLAVLVISIPLVLQQNTASGNGATLVHGLFTRPLQVTPKPDGLAQVTLTAKVSQHISPEIEQAGRTTQLIFNFNRSQP
jgi:hypothetical protein